MRELHSRLNCIKIPVLKYSSRVFLMYFTLFFNTENREILTGSTVKLTDMNTPESKNKLQKNSVQKSEIS